MKVLFAPDWRSGNAYQQLLAEALAKQGVEVVFAPQVQRLFRLKKVAQAVGDFDLLHLHWPEAYFPTLHDRRDALRRWFFPLDLRLALGQKPLVYTAHNLYPHNRGQESSVRRAVNAVVKRADAIVAHGPAAADAMVTTFGVARSQCHVVPHGDLAVTVPAASVREEARTRLGLGAKPVCLVFGAVDPYKGIEEVLTAWAQAGEMDMELAIVGGVKDPAYAAALEAQVARMPNRAGIRLHLQRVEGRALADWMTAADSMLFNYRSILTSGSACLARSWGVPIALPARLNTVDLMEPCANVVRFGDAPGSLLAAVRQAAAVGHLPEEAARYRAATAWDEIARQTANMYRQVLAGRTSGRTASF